MDARSHILNDPERTSLLGSQVCFEESDLGLKKTPYISCEVLTILEKSTRDLLTIFNELKGEIGRMLKMRGDKYQRREKLVPSVKNKPEHHARNMRKIKTLGERLLKEKGVKLQRKKSTTLSDDKSRDEGL